MSDYESQLRQMAGMQNAAQSLGFGQVSLANANKPPAIISQQLQTLEERISIIAKVLTELEQRLCPILRSMPVSPETAKDKPLSTGVPLGDSLMQQAEKLQDALNKVRFIMDRLEL